MISLNGRNINTPEINVTIGSGGNSSSVANGGNGTLSRFDTLVANPGLGGIRGTLACAGDGGNSGKGFIGGNSQCGSPNDDTGGGGAGTAANGVGYGGGGAGRGPNGWGGTATATGGSAAGANAPANRGGGGSASNGGSGVVYVEYPYVPLSADSIGGILTFTNNVNAIASTNIDTRGEFGTFVFNGAISGSGTINILASLTAGGMVKIANANAYTGTFEINSGTSLIYLAAPAAGSSYRININAGATLDKGGFAFPAGVIINNNGGNIIP